MTWDDFVWAVKGLAGLLLCAVVFAAVVVTFGWIGHVAELLLP